MNVRTQRVLAIGLDGYERSLECEMMGAGELPALSLLRAQSARFLLDHGPAQRTGLAWEHVSSGLSPAAANRWAAVHFDPNTYTTWQEGTSLQPFPARLRSRTVVFDAPYFDLGRAPQVRGVVGWGAHDPGIPFAAQPADVLTELAARFGSYPASEFIYGHVWPSAQRAREMGEQLALATETRMRAARWLLAERLPDWDLALVVASEPHSAIEGLWHGSDRNHPLHRLPSAEAARNGLLSVYRAVDRLVGDLAAAFSDAAIVVFSMGGMGPNRSDVPSMVLLPELMYRQAFGRPFLRQPAGWSEVTGAGPALGECDNWADAVNANLPLSRLSIARRLMARLRNRVRPDSGPLRSAINWMPAAHYQTHWHSMPAFALPSFYDGRIRINLAGRERKGMVSVSQYETVCADIEALLRECKDPTTGAGVVDYIERPQGRDPLAMGPTDSDLVVVWKGLMCALDHPRFGRIGPVPFRRPGGHTGRFGMAYIHSSEIRAGEQGVRSSFDVVPTLIELLGEPLPAGLSGKGMLSTIGGYRSNEKSGGPTDVAVSPR
jgi:predicted AlkP superfamily phosphohydrolase/phosphomutase